MSEETLPAVQTVPLQAQARLEIETLPGRNLIRLIGSDERVQLTLEITPQGPVLRFEQGLALQTAGPLAIAAESVAIHGRDGLLLSCGGDAQFEIQGDLTQRARIHNVEAVLGNVNIKANDDVRLNGERVKVNC